MTPRPRPYHRAEAERLLDYADEWTAQAGELSPEASELSCLAYAAVHALLAIHDALTASDRYATNEARQREEAEPDPLDEDDHRNRIDVAGNLWGRNPSGCWHTRFSRECRTLPYLNEHYGPLAFAPEAAQEATGGDLSASEGESGSVEGGDDDDAQKAILCPECDHHINTHNAMGCRHSRCGCPRTPEDVARALTADAVNTERTRLTDQLRATTNSVIAELDELAAWETNTDG